MSIKIEEIASGFACYFPYELKDSFKNIFPSAKWNPNDRRWEVGKRSLKRLEDWATLASPAAQDIEDAKAAELTEAESRAIEQELIDVRLRIANARKQTCNYHQTLEALTTAKKELLLAEAALHAEQENVQHARQEANELLSKVCDVVEIASAHNQMRRHYGKTKHGATARDAFNDARKRLRQQQDKLNTIGYYSVGLNILIDCNFNRPDRDNPAHVTQDQIFVLKEWNDD